jgi:hypothetical protein
MSALSTGNLIERRDGVGNLLQSYTTDAKGRITMGGYAIFLAEYSFLNIAG